MNFDYLDAILEMNFSQLRANNGRATDEAIVFFVSNLNLFFTKNDVKHPTPDETITFHKKMSAMISKINEAEYNYYLVQHQNDGSSEEEIANIAANYELTLEKLPDRMQYWAATEVFGEAVRNSSAHIIAVKFLSACFDPQICRHTLFRGQKLSEEIMLSEEIIKGRNLFSSFNTSSDSDDEPEPNKSAPCTP